MKATILFQRVSEGDNVLYGEQHRNLKRDLRSELNSLGLSSDGEAAFVRLEQRREGLVLAVGRQGIAGREGDYEAAWVLIPWDVLDGTAARGELSWYVQKMREFLEFQQGDETILRQLEEQELDRDQYPLQYTLSLQQAAIAYRLYDNQAQLNELLKDPVQKQYSEYKAVYLLEHSAHSQPRGGSNLTYTSVNSSVLITPPAQAKLPEAGVASLKLCAADGREWEFKQPMRFPFGESITLEWRHQCSLYQVYKQELTCERNQQLDVPSDDKWEWKFDTSKFEVLINERRKSIQNFEVLINEKPATPTYTRDQLLRGCSVVINCLGYEKVSKTVKEKDLAKGSIEFRLSLISKPAPSPAPGYSQGHLTKRLNMWKVATFALGLVLLLSWGALGYVIHSTTQKEAAPAASAKENTTKSASQATSQAAMKQRYQDTIQSLRQRLGRKPLHDLLGERTWTKRDMDLLVPNLFDALKRSDFAEAIRLSNEVLNENGELGRLIYKCRKLMENNEIKSSQIRDDWPDQINRNEYIQYLSNLQPTSNQNKGSSSQNHSTSSGGNGKGEKVEKRNN